MAPSRHKAVIAGLALTLTLGTAAAPAVATLSNESPTTDTDPNGMGAPKPADYNKGDFFAPSDGGTTFAMARSTSRLSPVGLSSEMKYFAEFESASNYDQGLSYGDGYNAMGFYQFDRRYGLFDFLEQVYDHNPSKYSMLKKPLANRDLLSDEDWTAFDYTTDQLKAPAQELNEAWHKAYKADPDEFSALQDSYAYNTYYLPVQSILLNSYGIDVRNRADCVKGLVWGMCNLFGPGSSTYENGCRYFFKKAKLSNSMTDRELVTALCNAVINNVADRYPSQPQYHAGWQNRYKKEKAVCLKYVAEDEAEANKPKPEANKPKPPVAERPQLPSNPSTGGPSAGDPDAGGPGAGDRDAGGPGAGDSHLEDGDTSKPNAGDKGDTPSGDEEDKDDAGQGGAGGGDSDDKTDPGSNSTGGGNSGSVTSPNDDKSENGTHDKQNGSGNDANSGSNDAGSSSDPNKTPDSDKETDKDSAEGDGSEDDGSNDTSDDEKSGNKDSRNNDAESSDKTEDRDKRTSDDGDPEDTAGKNVMNTDADDEPKGALPQTGDIGMLVMTGAAGFAVAGGSFISLGKIETKGFKDEDETEE